MINKLYNLESKIMAAYHPTVSRMVENHQKTLGELITMYLYHDQEFHIVKNYFVIKE